MQEFGVVSYTLLLSLIEYKTLVLREDMEAAQQLLPTIPKVCFPFPATRLWLMCFDLVLAGFCSSSLCGKNLHTLQHVHLLANLFAHVACKAKGGSRKHTAASMMWVPNKCKFGAELGYIQGCLLSQQCGWSVHTCMR